MLFSEFKIGEISVKNRIAMAPLTRMRAGPGDVPTDMVTEYYRQRAGAGLIISEGVPISDVARGYSKAPCIYTKEQIEGWKKVTQAVHENDGKIFAQIWHVGRRSHELISGEQPVAPSAVVEEDRVHRIDENGEVIRMTPPVPRAMTKEDIHKTIENFAQAAKNAIVAGFDGVEIHGAHGYLLDSFMRKAANVREDEYGGSKENRMRFVMEVVEAVVKEVGGARTAIRLSPHVTEGTHIVDDEIVELMFPLLKKLEPLNLAYVHFSENLSQYVEVPESFRKQVRAEYHNPIMVCGKKTKEIAEELLEKNYTDMVAFGIPYILNPDLAERLQKGQALTPMGPDTMATLFGGGAAGYTDYKTAE